MSLQDPIANMLAQIKNGQMAKKEMVITPASKSKASILNVLEEEGYITGYEVQAGIKPTITVYLKYFKQKPVIAFLKRISKPGLRVYKRKDALPKVLGGLGISILSTPKGVMSDRKARLLGQGGEILCQVA